MHLKLFGESPRHHQVITDPANVFLLHCIHYLLLEHYHPTKLVKRTDLGFILVFHQSTMVNFVQFWYFLVKLGWLLCTHCVFIITH